MTTALTTALRTDDRSIDRIQLEFDEARANLVAARAAQRRKDTPAARACVASCLARVDSLLDMWNDGFRLTP
jgi:hypothetical protein